MKRENIFHLLMLTFTVCIGIWLIYFISIPSQLVGHAWDDYSYSGLAQFKGIWKTAIDIYHYWNGRFFSNFSLAIYYKYTELEQQQNHMWIFHIFLFLFISYLFLRKYKIDLARHLYLSLILGLGWLISLPSISKGISWNTGSFNYLLPFLLATIVSNLYLTYKNRWSYLALLPLYIFLLSGEVIPILFVIFYLLYAIIENPQFTRKKSMLGLLTSLASLVTILLSPGYAKHATYYHYENIHNFIFSFNSASIKTMRLFTDGSFLFPLLAGIMLLLMIDRRKQRRIEHLIPLFSAITFFLIAFSVYWNQGFPPPPRINNATIAAIFLPLCYYFWGLCSSIKCIPSLKREDYYFAYPIFFLSFIALSTIPTHFYGARLLEVYLSGKDPLLPQYRQYRIDMLTYLKNHSGEDIIYPKFKNPAEDVPLGLHHSQENEDHSWIRSSLVRKYRLKSFQWGNADFRLK